MVLYGDALVRLSTPLVGSSNLPGPIFITMNKEQKNRLVKRYKNLGQLDIEILEEWEVASRELDEL